MDIEEKLPARMPEPLGIPVTISAFVGANTLVSLSLFRMHQLFGFPRGKIQWSLHDLVVSLWPCGFARSRLWHFDTS